MFSTITKSIMLQIFMPARVLRKIEGNYLLYILLVVPFLYYIIFKKLKSLFTTKNASPFPPGPAPWPILGNIVQMGDLPHVTLANYAQTYGPLVLLRLGTQYTVVASSPAAAMEVLKTHDHALYARHVPKAIPGNQAQLNKSSVVWSEALDDGWRSLRALLRTELFSVKALNAQSSLREKKMMELVEYLKDQEGQVVNISELVFATVFNMLSNMLLSKDLIGLEEKVIDGGMKAVIREMMELGAAPNISDFYPFLSKLDLQSLLKQTIKSRRSLLAMWLPIIQARKESGASLNQQDFLDVLLHKNFTDYQIDQLLFDMFVAGSDTSTATVEWAMTEIIKSPETMKRVHKELDEELSLNPVQESSVTKFPYLQACIKETYRLHPPTPLLLPRRAPETCQLMNYTIPKDGRILVNVWAIGRDPLIWNDPLKYNPERFLDSGLDFKGNNFQLLPFGAGRRICPGMSLAGVVIPLVLATLLHSFDWLIPDGEDPQMLDMKEKFGLTLQKKHPLLLIPKLRK